MILEELVSVLGLEIRDTGLSTFRSSLTSTIGKLGLALAGSVSAAAAISDFLSTVEQTSETAKFSRAIGIQTRDLLRLRYAADQAGISAGGLDSVLSGITQGLSQVDLGGTISTDLGRIGLSARDASENVKDAQTILMELADFYANSTDKNMAFGLLQPFGIDPAFKTLFDGGSAGLRNKMAEAFIPSDSEIAESSRFDRVTDRLDQLRQSLAFKVGTPFLEGATTVLEKLLNYVDSPAFKTLKTQIGELADGLGRAFENIKKFYEELAKTLPAGSTVGALLAALAVAFPATAAVTATAVAGGYVMNNPGSVPGVVVQGEIDGFKRLWGQVSAAVTALDDAVTSFGNSEYFNHPPRGFLSKEIDGAIESNRESINGAIGTVNQTFNVIVQSVKEATGFVDEVSTPESIRDPAKRNGGRR